jgi:hypothetical protein
MESRSTHKHHIIPRYAGGLNSPENLIEVSVSHHALIHWWYYCMWGNIQDLAATYLLLGMDKETLSLGGKMGAESLHNRREKEPEFDDWWRGRISAGEETRKTLREDPDYDKRFRRNRAKAAGVANKKKYQCTVTGHISSARGLGKFQRNRGIPTNCRIPVN